jgi:hypothetical protein
MSFCIAHYYNLFDTSLYMSSNFPFNECNSMVISWLFDLVSMTLCISSTEILLLSKYYKSLLATFSSNKFYTSSKLNLVSIDEATSATVLDTSDTLAFKDNPAFNSDLLALVGTTLSSSLMANPYDLTTSFNALSVNFTMSYMFFHSLDPYSKC